MKIIIQSYSTPGSVRNYNEDEIDVLNNLDGSDQSNIPILYSGIFDGHGGGMISKALVDKSKINISKYFCNIYSPTALKIGKNKTFNEKKIIPLFEHIQEKLRNYYTHSNKMGSTALISLLYPRNNKYLLKIINLGDCRAIICNDHNIANQLTLDHKPHLLVEKKRILEMGGILQESENDDPRIGGMSVSRSFGDLDNKFISQIPDIFDYNINTEKFLIMGCDGVWDSLQNQDASDFVLEKINELKINKKQLKNLTGKSEINIAQKLAEYSITKGSQDNISVVIIFFQNNI
jgi:serine/threonine protein phosphatase PrpC